MQKIKVRSQEQKITGKQFNPVEFYNLNRGKIIRFSTLIVVVILCLAALRIWQGNKRANIPVVLSQARELFFSGKYEAAISLYKQFPENPIAILGAAYCYEELGNINEARRVFLQVKDKPWIDDAVKGVERLK